MYICIYIHTYMHKYFCIHMHVYGYTHPHTQKQARCQKNLKNIRAHSPPPFPLSCVPSPLISAHEHAHTCVCLLTQFQAIEAPDKTYVSAHAHFYSLGAHTHTLSFFGFAYTHHSYNNGFFLHVYTRISGNGTAGENKTGMRGVLLGLLPFYHWTCCCTRSGVCVCMCVCVCVCVRERERVSE